MTLARRARPPAVLVLALALAFASGGLEGASAAAVQATPWASRGPVGGTPTALAVDPENPATVYAGTDGGLFVSANGGVDWRRLQDGPVNTVTAVVVDPVDSNVVYAAASTGVYRTSNGGTTWTVGQGTLDRPFADLVLVPTTPGTLFAASDDQVFKSVDHGMTWSRASGGMGEADVIGVQNLAVDPSDPLVAYAAVQIFCDGCFSGDVMKTTDGGATWDRSDSGLNGPLVYSDVIVDPVDPSTVFVKTIESTEGSGGVLVSHDAGATWADSSTGLPRDESGGIDVRTLVMDPLDPTVLYVSIKHRSELFVTSDSGDQWTAIETGTKADHFSPLVIDPTNDEVMYAGTDGRGVQKSETEGSSWVAQAAGLRGSSVVQVGVAPSDSTIMYASVLGLGVFRTVDGGRRWQRTEQSLPVHYSEDVTALAVDPVDPQTVYGATYGHGVFQSSDGGRHWRRASNGLTDPYISSLVIDPSNPDVIYAGGDGRDGGVYGSLDGGRHWSLLAVGLGTYPHVSDLAMDPLDPNTLYAVSQDSSLPSPKWTVYATVDGGRHWTLRNAGMESVDVSDVAVSPADDWTLYAATYDGVYRTSNGGANWQRTGTWIPTPGRSSFSDVAADPFDPDIASVAVDPLGVWRTTDGGATWSEFNAELTARSVNQLVILDDGSLLLAATTGGGVMATALSSG